MAARSANTPKSPLWRPFKMDAVRDAPVKVDIVATPEERDAVARALAIPALSKLEAHLRVAKAPRGRFEATGEVLAKATRICVVSLDPFEAEIREPVGIFFAEAPRDHRKSGAAAPAEIVVRPGDDDPPEPIVDGRVDLGAVVVEFLALGLDPYPRGPGADFGEIAPSPSEDGKASPFRVLAKLRGDSNDG